MLAEKLRAPISGIPLRGSEAAGVPPGYVYMVTDWEDYAHWALDELSRTPLLKNAYEGFAAPQSWRPQTKFECKGIEKNHAVWELFFERKE
jgi:tRNA (guanine-N7-)-methyltransferase